MKKLSCNEDSASGRGKIIFPMSEVDKAYIAGLFDGEGNISIHCEEGRNRSTAQYYSLRCTIRMTHFPVVEWVQEVTGLGSLLPLKIQPRKGNGKGNDPNLPQKAKHNKAILAWTLGTRQAEQFLMAIRPYTKVKAEEIDTVLEFAKWTHDVQEEFTQLRQTTGTFVRIPDWYPQTAERYCRKLSALKSKCFLPKSAELLEKLRERYVQFGITLDQVLADYKLMEETGGFATIDRSIPKYTEAEVAERAKARLEKQAAKTHRFRSHKAGRPCAGTICAVCGVEYSVHPKHTT